MAAKIMAGAYKKLCGIEAFAESLPLHIWCLIVICFQGIADVQAGEQYENYSHPHPSKIKLLKPVFNKRT
jgi:hypothetical protein